LIGCRFRRQRKLKTADDYRHYIGFLNDIPRFFRDETANMRAGLARGFTPPKVTMVGQETPVSVTCSISASLHRRRRQEALSGYGVIAGPSPLS